MELFTIIVLTLSGLALIYACTMRLVYPNKGNFLKTYTKNPENVLAKDTDLLNEIRGIGAVMLVSGLVILLGVSMPSFRQTSLVVATVIFVGVAAGRLTSFSVDGIPDTPMERATIFEIILAVLNVAGLVMSFLDMP